MNLSLKKLTLVIFSMLFSIGLVASDNQLPYQDNLAKSILQHDPELIQSYHPGKLYLNREHIAFEENGIFLESSNESFALPVLLSDEGGCYLHVHDAGIPVICGKCGYEFEINEYVTSCPNCGHGEWPRG